MYQNISSKNPIVLEKQIQSKSWCLIVLEKWSYEPYQGIKVPVS